MFQLAPVLFRRYGADSCVGLRNIAHGFYFVHISTFYFPCALERVLIPLAVGLNRSHGRSLRQESTAITMGDVSVGRKHAVRCRHGDVSHKSEEAGANSRRRCKECFL